MLKYVFFERKCVFLWPFMCIFVATLTYHQSAANKLVTIMKKKMKTLILAGFAAMALALSSCEETSTLVYTYTVTSESGSLEQTTLAAIQMYINSVVSLEYPFTITASSESEADSYASELFYDNYVDAIDDTEMSTLLANDANDDAYYTVMLMAISHGRSQDIGSKTWPIEYAKVVVVRSEDSKAP